TNGMSDHTRRAGAGDGLQAELRNDRLEFVRREATDDERSTIKFTALKFKRFFGGVHSGVSKLVPQRDQRIVAVVIDHENRTRPANASRSFNPRSDFSDRDVENFDVRDPNYFDIKEFAKRPSRVVVRAPLRIVRTPVLIIEKHVGDAAVGLIHPDKIRTRGELDALGRSFFFLICASLLGLVVLICLRFAHHSREWSVGLNNLTTLQSQKPQQFGLFAAARIVGWKNVSCGSFVFRLFDGTFALQIEVLQE